MHIKNIVFIFEKKDLNNESIKKWRVWAGNSANQGKDKFILLTCQFQIIIELIIKQTLWKDSDFCKKCLWVFNYSNWTHLKMLYYNVIGIFFQLLLINI